MLVRASTKVKLFFEMCPVRRTIDLKCGQVPSLAEIATRANPKRMNYFKFNPGLIWETGIKIRSESLHWDRFL